MKRVIASLVCLAAVVGFALFPKEYARVSSPDGRYVAAAKYYAYRAWLPMSPGDGGRKEGWILVVAKDGEKIGAVPVDMVSRIQELRWTSDSVGVPCIWHGPSEHSLGAKSLRGEPIQSVKKKGT
jgi:hypothetical protein